MSQQVPIVNYLALDDPPQLVAPGLRGGDIAVNISGGVLPKGHRLGATGIANIFEVATHLRGEVGDRQVDGSTVGLTHVIGLRSTCSVDVLEKGAL